MNDIIHFDTIDQYNKFFKKETLHPLVSVINLSTSPPIRHNFARYGFYAVFMKELADMSFDYGRGKYDYQEGTIVSIAPGQITGAKDNGKEFQLTGRVLAFHPDFIRGTALGDIIQRYGFFSYESNEALHLSDREKKIVLDCFDRIGDELNCNVMDNHIKSLVIDTIKLLLDYCLRFYDRQFITREHINKDVLVRFEKLLDDYLLSASVMTEPLSVQLCAERLNMSADYFSDLINKLTGMPALTHIHNKLIDVAKERLLGMGKSVSEVAYDLGFQYPQHFTRLFKSRVGMTPTQYRSGGVS